MLHHPYEVNPSSCILQGYFGFILLSTAVRSFEAGVVASMMPAIRQGPELHLLEV